MAGTAGDFDDLAPAAACRAGLLKNHHAPPRRHLAGAVTRTAGRQAVALRPRAAAAFAGFLGRETNRLVRAVIGLFEGHGQGVLEVGAAGRTRGTSAATHEIAKDAVEDVAKAAEPASAGRAGLEPLLEGRVPHLVIGAAPFRVFQDLVGTVDILERLLGLAVSRIAVGVVLLGQASVRTLDGLCVGVALDAQDFIEVRHANPCRLAAERTQTAP